MGREEERREWSHLEASGRGQWKEGIVVIWVDEATFMVVKGKKGFEECSRALVLPKRWGH